MFNSCKITVVNKFINYSSELKRFQVAAVLAIKSNPQQFYIKINKHSQARCLSFVANGSGLILMVEQVANAGMEAKEETKDDELGHKFYSNKFVEIVLKMKENKLKRRKTSNSH